MLCLAHKISDRLVGTRAQFEHHRRQPQLLDRGACSQPLRCEFIQRGADEYPQPLIWRQDQHEPTPQASEAATTKPISATPKARADGECHRTPVPLDELEKAHPHVLNVLLRVLDDGCMTDRQGRTVDFKRIVLVMTSNLGSHDIQRMAVRTTT